MKTLVITGASTGIGLAAATLFQKQGCRVINLSRRPCRLDGVENIAVDFSDTKALAKACEMLSSKIEKGDPIYVVHNAATSHMESVWECTAQIFQDTMQVNVMAPMLINQCLAPYFSDGSAILFVGSTVSEIGVKQLASYTVSKHAIAGLMKCTLQDLTGFPAQVHTCCICPGFTDTEMLENMPEGTLEFAKQSVSANRLIAPEEIAKSLFFCAQNPVINGAMIHANLGQLTN